MNIKILDKLQNIANPNLDQFWYDKVLIENSFAKENFNIRKFSNKPWKRKLLKIKRNDLSIYRLFYSGSNKKFSKGEIGLTANSLTELDVHYNDFIEKEENNEDKNYSFGCDCLKISTVPRFPYLFCFFWNHPIDSTRVSFKYSIVLSIISILISLAVSFCKIH